jgi:organic radical activating enzyme
MLKLTSTQKKDNITEHLLQKGRMIVINNVCNLTCGGCCQLIGHFRKDQLWFIDLEELERNISLLEEFPNTANTPITIFGGEPTLHPNWNEIVLLLKKHKESTFWINTNGRLGHKRYQKEDNLVWWVDLHPDNQLFVQTLYAAKDAINLSNDMAYWEKAQKDCCMWKGCQSSIYNGKSYFCETAAALDWLYNDGKNGWALSEHTHPFMKTKEEIDNQAKELCKRCGWCVAEKIPRQFSKDPTYVSSYNELEHKKNSLAVIQPVVAKRWKYYESFGLPPKLGIYRLLGDCSFSEKIKITECSWEGVTYDVAKNIEEALSKGRKSHDWTIVLRANQVIPHQALSSLISWMSAESLKEKPRFQVSLPLFDMSGDCYDPNMNEPLETPKNVIIGFHRESNEVYDENIFTRLGHRNIMEGSGRSSLWHDQLTDIVGGVINLI